MKFREFLEAANNLAKEHPEVLDLDVCQTSCFDSPYRFDTNNLFIGETYDVVASEDEEALLGSFTSGSSAEERAQEEDGKVVTRRAVIFEAF